MFSYNQQLINSIDFDNAMYFGVPVSVYHLDGELSDYGGLIEKHTENCVYINGGYFIKENCIFKVRRSSSRIH